MSSHHPVVVSVTESRQLLQHFLADESLTARISDRQFFQGPLSDAMTHAGQLAMLRRLVGSPVPSENFIFAEISSDNVTANQPDPAAPDAWWKPETPPVAPGTHASKLADDLVDPGKP